MPDDGAGHWDVRHEEFDGTHLLEVVAPDGVSYAIEAQRENALFAVTVHHAGNRIAALLLAADCGVDCRFPGSAADLYVRGDLEQAVWTPECEFVVTAKGPQLRITDAQDGSVVALVSPTVMANALVVSVDGGDQRAGVVVPER